MNPMMLSVRWVIAVVVVVALIGIGVWSYTQLAPAENQLSNTTSDQGMPTPDLTIDQIKNATYRIDSRIITLVDGKFSVDYSIVPEKDGLPVTTVYTGGIYNNNIVIGDLDRDGDKDAVVVLTTSTNEEGAFRTLAYIENVQGKPVFNAEVSLGEGVVVNSAAIQEQKIVLDMVIHGPADSPCCPTVPQEVTYMVFEDTPTAPENSNTITESTSATTQDTNAVPTETSPPTTEESADTGGTLVEVTSELERIQAFCEKEGHALPSELISVGQFDATTEIESVVVCHNATTQLYHIYVLEPQGSGQIVADIQATEIEQDFSHQQANVQQIDLEQDGIKELLIVSQVNNGTCSYISSIAHVYVYPTRTLYSKQIMKSANTSCNGYLPPEVTYSNNVGSNTRIRETLDFALQGI